MEVGGERGLRPSHLQEVQDIASFSKHGWVTASTQGGAEIISEKPLSDQKDSEPSHMKLQVAGARTAA